MDLRLIEHSTELSLRRFEAQLSQEFDGVRRAECGMRTNYEKACPVAELLLCAKAVAVLIEVFYLPQPGQSQGRIWFSRTPVSGDLAPLAYLRLGTADLLLIRGCYKTVGPSPRPSP
ncbi:hypothetical protein BaRGS_00034946 [Batillaria attramentaria]|uniref:Uncharacterized protein n=1 Tax=Batillaria attramentaria TaxID=370345 RepID=A0ABD0JFZ9_9CAEN